MKNISFTYRLNVLFLSFLMLFSTIGFSMDIHYCGGEIDNIGFYEKADVCKMMKQDTGKNVPACHQKNAKKCHNDNSQNRVSQKSCCDNQTFVLSSLDESQSVNGYELSNTNLTFITIFVLASYNLFKAETTSSLDFVRYSTPLLKQEVTILHQVFLI
ncbi:MAG TPA: hypothetical protein EYG85_11860 [Crocinitomix sp.]|nr:hypothetical protein [Crocinitomix sp.]